MTLIGFIKDKKRFLLGQSVMNLFFAAGYVFLGAISGTVANICTMTRNFVCIKWNLSTPLKILFIAIQIVLTLITDDMSFMMWLPILSYSLFTWFMDSDSAKTIKVVAIAGQLLWLFYDIHYKNYSVVLFDIAAAITNSIALISITKSEKTGSEKYDNQESK